MALPRHLENGAVEAEAARPGGEEGLKPCSRRGAQPGSGSRVQPTPSWATAEPLGVAPGGRDHGGRECPGGAIPAGAGGELSGQSSHTSAAEGW